MSKRRAAIAISLLAFFFLVGCVSKPKKPGPTASPAPTPSPTATPEPTPSPEPSKAPDAELTENQAKAQELRKKVIDYGLNERMREEFLKAEESYSKGAEAYGKDDTAAKAAYADAITGYQFILEAGLSSLVDEGRAKAGQMREAARLRGAETQSPEALASGDAYATDGQAKQAAGDKEGAIAAYRSALMEFDIAYTLARSVQVKTEIDERGYASSDSGNYELAGQKLDEARSRYADDRKGSLDSGQEALLRFNIVLKKGWESALGERRSLTDVEKQKADEIKSERATPMEYQAAKSAYDEAMLLEGREQYSEAEAKYAESTQLFQEVYVKAKEKLERATTSLDSLKARQDASRQKAVEGDSKVNKSSQGGAQ